MKLSKWSAWPLAIMLTLLLTGCFAGTTKTEPNSRGIEQKPHKEIDYFDSEVFDLKLGLSMRSKLPAITVKPIEPITINNIPDRLDKWLAAVEEYGGKVELKPDPDHRTRMLGAIVDLVVKTYQAVKQVLLFKAAENYDCTLYYIPGNGTVTKVVFTLKPGC